MKTNKLIAAGALALSMAMTPVASLINAMPVMADTLTITNPKSDVTYTAYQIFSGSVTELNGKKVLANIVWGDGINDAGKVALAKLALGTEYQESDDVDTDGYAARVAEAMKAEADNSTKAKTFAETAAANAVSSTGKNGTVSGDNVVFSDLSSGYYVVKDNATTADKASAVIMTIVGDTEVTIKTTDIPTSEKKVSEGDNTISGSPTISVKGPNGSEQWNDVADYDIGETIPFEISAKLPSDLSHYNNYEITFKDTMDAGFDLVSNSISVYVGDSTTPVTLPTGALTITGNDFNLTLKVKENGNFANECSENAIITVRFNAKLNAQAQIGNSVGNVNHMSLEYPVKPGTDQKGTTPEDKVIVFTYDLKINKKGNGDQDLTGAEFYLTNGEQYFSGTKNNDGSFTFNSWVDFEAQATKIVGKTVNEKLTNQFEIKGIDDGNYSLIECTAPDGYQKPANPFAVEIIATTVNDQEWLPDEGATDANTSVKAKVGDTSYDNTTVTILNTPGGSLPETGGMGTTMIYGVGAVMVAGAAVFYVTNKRTRKD